MCEIQRESERDRKTVREIERERERLRDEEMRDDG